MEKTCYELYNSLYRSKGIKLLASFIISHDIYDDNGNDRGKDFRFEVTYYSNKGSRYVKVEYRIFGTTEFIQLADHDSCWSGCWDKIIIECREKLNKDFPEIKGHEDSWFSNCVDIKIDGEI
jgi:hypothetical protein